jgi:hypothetical protein
MRLLDYLNHVDTNLNHIVFFMEARMGGQFFTFFNLKNMISTHTNDFCEKQNGPNFPDFEN